MALSTSIALSFQLRAAGEEDSSASLAYHLLSLDQELRGEEFRAATQERYWPTQSLVPLLRHHYLSQIRKENIALLEKAKRLERKFLKRPDRSLLEDAEREQAATGGKDRPEYKTVGFSLKSALGKGPLGSYSEKADDSDPNAVTDDSKTMEAHSANSKESINDEEDRKLREDSPERDGTADDDDDADTDAGPISQDPASQLDNGNDADGEAKITNLLADPRDDEWLSPTNYVVKVIEDRSLPESRYLPYEKLESILGEFHLFSNAWSGPGDTGRNKLAETRRAHLPRSLALSLRRKGKTSLFSQSPFRGRSHSELDAFLTHYTPFEFNRSIFDMIWNDPRPAEEMDDKTNARSWHSKSDTPKTLLSSCRLHDSVISSIRMNYFTPRRRQCHSRYLVYSPDYIPAARDNRSVSKSDVSLFDHLYGFVKALHLAIILERTLVIPSVVYEHMEGDKDGQLSKFVDLSLFFSFKKLRKHVCLVSAEEFQQRVMQLPKGKANSFCFHTNWRSVSLIPFVRGGSDVGPDTEEGPTSVGNRTARLFPDRLTAPPPGHRNTLAAAAVDDDDDDDDHEGDADSWARYDAPPASKTRGGIIQPCRDMTRPVSEINFQGKNWFNFVFETFYSRKETVAFIGQSLFRGRFLPLAQPIGKGQVGGKDSLSTLLGMLDYVRRIQKGGSDPRLMNILTPGLLNTAVILRYISPSSHVTQAVRLQQRLLLSSLSGSGRDSLLWPLLSLIVSPNERGDSGHRVRQLAHRYYAAVLLPRADRTAMEDCQKRKYFYKASALIADDGGYTYNEVKDSYDLVPAVRRSQPAQRAPLLPTRDELRRCVIPREWALRQLVSAFIADAGRLRPDLNIHAETTEGGEPGADAVNEELIAQWKRSEKYRNIVHQEGKLLDSLLAPPLYGMSEGIVTSGDEVLRGTFMQTFHSRSNRFHFKRTKLEAASRFCEMRFNPSNEINDHNIINDYDPGADEGDLSQSASLLYYCFPAYLRQAAHYWMLVQARYYVGSEDSPLGALVAAARLGRGRHIDGFMPRDTLERYYPRL